MASPARAEGQSFLSWLLRPNSSELFQWPRRLLRASASYEIPNLAASFFNQWIILHHQVEVVSPIRESLLSNICALSVRNCGARVVRRAVAGKSRRSHVKLPALRGH